MEKEILCTIAANIYHVTGCPDYPWDGSVVSNVERRVKTYLNAVIAKAIRKIEKKKRRNVTSGVNRANCMYSLKPGHIFEALRSTPEYYGVKYSILWKKLKRKINVDQADPMEPDVTVDDDPVDVLKDALSKLDDNSQAYERFSKEKQDRAVEADRLTRFMSLSEYQKYHRKRKIKLTDGQLRYWLNWEKMNSDMVTIFSWLSSYKIKKVVQKALCNCNRFERSLFTDEETEYARLRTVPIAIDHFVEGNEITEALQQSLRTLMDDTDRRFSLYSSPSCDFGMFDTVATIRKRLSREKLIRQP